MSDAAEVGSFIGRYRIARELGRGGMGVVYEVVHDEIGRRAAIKVLSSRRSGDPRYLRRFLNEARAISAVHHPGLVQIYDFGETPSGVPYILMELLDGDSLRDRLVRRAGAGPMPLAEAHRIGRQIAAALTATHEAGIVHRDLKPENVMLTPDQEAPGGERVKLLDFGIARFVETHDLKLTEPGSTLGTAAYMSPEQCAGDAEIGAAVDVYALGVVLFELITGAPPFEGTTSSEIMRKHLVVDPPPLPASVPRFLAALAARMLAKEPTRRPAMREVMEALSDPSDTAVATEIPASPVTMSDRHDVTEDRDSREAGPAQSSLPAPTARGIAGDAPRRRRRWIVLASAAALVIAAAGAWLISQTPARGLHPVTGMVAIEGGRFRMDSTRAEVDAACLDLPGGCAENVRPQLAREQPPRDVTVSAFRMDAHEVTNQDYAAVLASIADLLEVREDSDNRYPRFVVERSTSLTLLDMHPRAGGIERTPDGRFVARPGQEDLPVNNVTWDGATRYCQQVGKRLPTEAEWELAAGGVEHRRFPWGNAPPSCDGVVFGRGETIDCPDRPKSLNPVATANQDVTPAGIHDLGGGVGEWVQDQLVDPAYGDCGSCVDPLFKKDVPAAQDFRVFRGGTYFGPAWMSRTTTRSRWKRTEVMEGLGFRCVTK